VRRSCPVRIEAEKTKQKTGHPRFGQGLRESVKYIARPWIDERPDQTRCCSRSNGTERLGDYGESWTAVIPSPRRAEYWPRHALAACLFPGQRTEHPIVASQPPISSSLLRNYGAVPEEQLAGFPAFGPISKTRGKVAKWQRRPTPNA
jgi:hypothetical protein